MCEQKLSFIFTGGIWGSLKGAGHSGIGRLRERIMYSNLGYTVRPHLKKYLKDLLTVSLQKLSVQ